ncbi:hypothetical protein [Brevibacterium oceani]|uniref:hypothetical protein n=1 Tax=Brevibacterium oceani TaxID=358099 RepID=UPI001B33F8E8|nr:hypothetical protein [Brevibacterium oceani]
MHRLVRQLDSFAPEASEALKIVAYFDVLISKDAGVDSLLRGAAMLSGGVAGAEFRGRTVRCDSNGRTLAGQTAAGATYERRGESWRVWLELDEEDHPTAEVIVERLGFGVALLDTRRTGEHGIEAALDPARTVSDRLAALARNHVHTTEPVRVIATLTDSPAPPGPSSILPTRFGLMRATIESSGGSADYPHRIGFGLRLRPDEAPESWNSAIIALHLTDEEVTRSFDVTELGSMLDLVKNFDPGNPHPDVVALASLDDRARRVLLALVEADSLRSAATELGMHHSTVQGRHESLTRALGYDPRSNLGRMRYIAAGLLYRFTDPTYLPSS